MNLIELIKRTAQLLTSIDEMFFKKTIEEIHLIGKGFTQKSYFHETFAKARVLHAASSAVNTLNYSTLDQAKQELVNSIFNDSLEEDIEARKEVDSVNIKTYHDGLKLFIESSEISKLVESKNDNKNISPSEIDIEDMINVEMNDSETCTTEDHQLIGTSDLGSCVGLCIIGQDNEENNVVTVSHLTSIEDADNVIDLMDEMCDNYNVDPDSQSVSLIGGCISSFPSNLKLLLDLCKNNIKFDDVMLCASNVEKECASIQINPENPVIRYEIQPYNKYLANIKRSKSNFFQASTTKKEDENKKGKEEDQNSEIETKDDANKKNNKRKLGQ